MTKIDILRRLLLGCFTIATPPSSTAVATTTKKRLSTSLRDDIVLEKGEDSPCCSSPECMELVPPRPSKSMVIGTFFGQRNGQHVYFCVETNRGSAKPSLLLELSLSTRNLVKEMGCGVLRIAMECKRSELGSCPLHMVPVWSLFCNGRRVGLATRRKAKRETREMLKKMQNITMGAGVMFGEESSTDQNECQRKDPEVIMYMRANYEWVIGGAHSESFHLVSGADESSGQELSIFLLRSA